jgi:hypothetical protein
MSRLLIFNLPRTADHAAVRALVDAWRAKQRHLPGPHAPADAPDAPAPVIALHTIDGAQGELFAVVHLRDDRRQARALARHLNGCRHVGGLEAPRPLWSWLPIMAWA